MIHPGLTEFDQVPGKHPRSFRGGARAPEVLAACGQLGAQLGGRLVALLRKWCLLTSWVQLGRMEVVFVFFFKIVMLNVLNGNFHVEFFFPLIVP